MMLAKHQTMNLWILSPPYTLQWGFHQQINGPTLSISYCTGLTVLTSGLELVWRTICNPPSTFSC